MVYKRDRIRMGLRILCLCTLLTSFVVLGGYHLHSLQNQEVYAALSAQHATDARQEQREESAGNHVPVTITPAPIVAATSATGVSPQAEAHAFF